MTNSLLLRNTITASGLKYKYIAQKLGITAYGLQKKIDNASEFKASEIEKLSIILNLSTTQRDQIFFALKSDLKSTTGVS